MGSSAKTTSGCETSARAIATRCCWPPESSDGTVQSRSPSRRSRSARSKYAWSGFSPAIESGRRMFSSAVSIGRRLKNWKTKPMWSRRSLVRSESLRVVISVPAIVTTRGRLVEPGKDVHQGRLARPGRPHHRGQSALRHLDVHTAQRVDGRLTLAVAPRQIAGDHDGPVLVHPVSSLARVSTTSVHVPHGKRGAANPTCGRADAS